MKVKSLIITLLILAIILGIIIGGYLGWRAFKLHRQQEIINENIKYYNGYKFTKFHNSWLTDVAVDKTLFNLEFRFLPNQTKNISIGGELATFSSRQVYVTFDPYESNLSYTSLAAYDVSSNLATVFNIEPVPACTSPKNGTCPPWPIASCDNDTLSVIYINVADKPGISMADRCITISGHGFDLDRAVDRLIYYLLGIMKA